MHAHAPYAFCPTAPTGPQLGNVAAELAGLSVAVVGLGVSAVRRAVERVAWGRCPCCCAGGGSGGCACGVSHHYCCACIPGCAGSSCC